MAHLLSGRYVSEPLKLGALAGNCFTIILRQVNGETELALLLLLLLFEVHVLMYFGFLFRNVSCDDHVINEVMQSLSDAGFVNYFGMQRFGTSTIPTHRVGE